MSMTRQEALNQIALIGETQSGKTTLAAGLAKCSDKGFSVGFADDTTREYLGGVISKIEGGGWPAGTGGENTDLAITLNLRGGCSTAVAFKEYKGEKFSDPTYVQKIVGNPNGALILLNPGMDLLQLASGRSKMLVNMKRIIDHLKSVSCTAIALVVTAHDRLSTDLAEFKPQFYEYLSEVENYLCTKKILWKRFGVTITGPLADQAAPTFAKGAGNTARAPFVWLMDRIEAKRRHSRLIKLLKGCALVAVILAAVTALGFGWKFWQEWKMLDAQESQALSCINEFDNAYKTSVKSEGGMKKATDNLCGVISSLKADRYWFHAIDSRRACAVADMQLKYDDLRYRYLQEMIKDRDDEKEGLTESDCKGVDNLINEFSPTKPALKSMLTNSWAKVRPRVRRKYDSRHAIDLTGKVCNAETVDRLEKILKEIEDWEASQDFCEAKSNLLIGAKERTDGLKGSCLDGDIKDINVDSHKKHDRTEIRGLGDRINSWEPHTDHGKEIKNVVIQTFNEKSKFWQQEITDHECNNAADSVCKELGTVELIEAVAIRKVLEKAADVIHGHTNATRTAWQNATNRVCRAQDSFLVRFGRKYTDKWTPEAQKRPALGKEDETFISDALDVMDITNCKEKLSVGFLKDLRGKLDVADSEWLSEQESRCDAFYKDTEGMSVVDLYEAYVKWYNDVSPDSPYVAGVNSNVERVVSLFFTNYIEGVDKTFIKDCSAFCSDNARKQAWWEFQKFSKLCSEINSSKKGGRCGIANSWCADLATGCFNAGVKNKRIDGAFRQTLTIKRIEVMLSEYGAYNDYRGGKFGLWVTREELKSEYKCEEVTHDVLMEADHQKNPSANKKDVYYPIWDKPRSYPVDPWANVKLNLWVTVSDGSGTNADGQIAIRLLPQDNTEHAERVLERSFTCMKRGKSYTCSCKIHCTFEGPDLFGMYKRCRKGGVAK